MQISEERHRHDFYLEIKMAFHYGSKMTETEKILSNQPVILHKFQSKYSNKRSVMTHEPSSSISSELNFVWKSKIELNDC